MAGEKIRFFSTEDIAIPDKYDINLTWINAALNEGSPYAFPCKNEEELIVKYIEKAAKWQDANPSAEVNIWYDSYFTTPKSVAATQSVLDQNKRFSTIKLRDIRDIEVVKNNPDSFSDRVPIYARVDLIKLILCVHSIETVGNDSAIYADLAVGDLRADNGRMPKDQLFNAEVMAKLKKYGLELGKDCRKVENQFIQVLNKPETLIALKLLIDSTLLRIVTTLNIARENKEILLNLDSGIVIIELLRTIPRLIRGLVATEDSNKIRVNLQAFDWDSPEEWVEYDPKTHGCIPFGNFFHRTNGCRIFIEKEHGSLVKSPEEAIKLPDESSEYQLGRNDTDTRSGGSHGVSPSKLPIRDPANGNTYQCVFMLSPSIPHKSTLEYN